MDRKTTPLYFLWDFHNRTLGLHLDKRGFLKKTSVFSITCDVNVELIVGLPFLSQKIIKTHLILLQNSLF